VPIPDPPKQEERVVGKSGRAAFTRGNDLWVTDAGGANERRVVDGKAIHVANADANLPGLDVAPAQSLSLSPDESRIYFMRDGWATSMALFYVEVPTSKVFFFHDANGYNVVDTCKDKKQIGRVITFEHSYFDINPMSASDYYFLVDSAEPKPGEQRTGRSGRVGIIGPDTTNVDRFLLKVCGQGKGAPDDPKKVPAKYLSNVKCKGTTYKHDDLKLLDGTQLLRFVPDDPAGEGVILSVDDVLELCSDKPDGG
jgi:hypothetical protein